MIKMLLTGSTGFLGRNFLERSYFKDGIVCVNREHNPLTTSIKEYSQVIEDNDVDCIVHCAAIVGKLKAPWRDYYAVNVDWTLKLAEAFALAKVNRRAFIYISSVGVYGSPRGSYGYYNKSKMLAEKGLKTIASKSGFPLTILRPTVMYGLGDKGFTWKLIRLSRRLVLPVPSGTLTHLLDVESMVRIIDGFVSSPESGTFNVADRHPIMLRELALFLKERIPGMRVIETSSGLALAMNWLMMPFRRYADMELLTHIMSYNAEGLRDRRVETRGTLELMEKHLHWYRL